MTDTINMPREVVEQALLPCPFCGEAKDLTVHVYGNGEDDAYVQCRECTTCGPDGGDRTGAILKWNQRAALSAAAEPVKPQQAQEPVVVAKLVIGPDDGRGARGVSIYATDTSNLDEQCAYELITLQSHREALAAALVKLTQWQEPYEWEHIHTGRRTKEKQTFMPENWRPLYTNHIPSQQEERKPLSVGRIVDMARVNYWHNAATTMQAYKEGVRDAEAAHSIKEQQ